MMMLLKLKNCHILLWRALEQLYNSLLALKVVRAVAELRAGDGKCDHRVTHTTVFHQKCRIAVPLPLILIPVASGCVQPPKEMQSYIYSVVSIRVGGGNVDGSISDACFEAG